MKPYAIDIKDFRKQYGDTVAVNNVSLQIKTGELMGLIGPDGAGKTTLMRTICTLLRPDGGEIRVQGYDVTRNISEIRQLLGYMPQRFSLYPDLSVEQNLNFFADIFQVEAEVRNQRLRQLYQFSRLEPFKHRKAADLSGGMKQKLALSCALIHTPPILVLDEPTFGVDPLSREEFWEILEQIRKEGTTIFVSTAYMEEADRCDRVALMHQGEILTTGTPAEIKSQFPYVLYEVVGQNLQELNRFFAQLPGVENTQLFGDSIHVSFLHDPHERDWQSWKQMSGQNLQTWKRLQPGIEDLFMEFIKTETA